MILALVLAAALTTPPTANPAAPPADAPVNAPVNAQDTPQDRMDALQQVYDQSCGSRGYGEYDDVCNSIREQIRQADKELAREAAHPHKAVARSIPSLPPAAAPPTAATPPAAAPPGGYSAAPSPPKP